MPKYLMSERQVKLLTETGSNSAAMDLDRYVQPVHFDTSNGNEGMIESIDEMIERLKEIKFSLEYNKEPKNYIRVEIFRLSDEVKNLHDKFVENP